MKNRRGQYGEGFPFLLPASSYHEYTTGTCGCQLLRKAAFFGVRHHPFNESIDVFRQHEAAGDRVGAAFGDQLPVVAEAPVEEL